MLQAASGKGGGCCRREAGGREGGRVRAARSWGEGTGSPAQRWWAPQPTHRLLLPLSHSWALKPTPKSQSVSLPLSPNDSGHGAVGQTTKKRAVSRERARSLVPEANRGKQSVGSVCWNGLSMSLTRVFAEICPQPHSNSCSEIGGPVDGMGSSPGALPIAWCPFSCFPGCC